MIGLTGTCSTLFPIWVARIGAAVLLSSLPEEMRLEIDVI
jgi:hypothetical protein